MTTLRAASYTPDRPAVPSAATPNATYVTIDGASVFCQHCGGSLALDAAAAHAELFSCARWSADGLGNALIAAIQSSPGRSDDELVVIACWSWTGFTSAALVAAAKHRLMELEA